MMGHLIEAEALFARAEKIIAEAKGPRTFRRITLKSGLLVRRVRLLLVQKRYGRAILHFCRGYFLAWEYRLRYGMPQRVKQYHRVIISTLKR